MTRQLFSILLFIFASSTMSQTTELKLYRAYGENHPLIITEEQQGRLGVDADGNETVGFSSPYFSFSSVFGRLDSNYLEKHLFLKNN